MSDSPEGPKQGARAIFCRLEPCLRCVLGNDAGDRIDPLRHAAGLICHVFLDHIETVRILDCGYGQPHSGFYRYNEVATNSY